MLVDHICFRGRFIWVVSRSAGPAAKKRWTWTKSFVSQYDSFSQGCLPIVPRRPSNVRTTDGQRNPSWKKIKISRLTLSGQWARGKSLSCELWHGWVEQSFKTKKTVLHFWRRFRFHNWTHFRLWFFLTILKATEFFIRPYMFFPDPLFLLRISWITCGWWRDNTLSLVHSAHIHKDDEPPFLSLPLP